MDSRKFDKIALRLGLVFTVMSLLCLIIVPKPGAEFTISIISLCISAAVTVAAAIRIRNDKDE